MIPWTPGCAYSCPSFLGARASAKLIVETIKILFGNLFKRLAPGRVAGGVFFLLIPFAALEVGGLQVEFLA